MLRPVSRARVQGILERSFFGIDNFKIEYGSLDDDVFTVAFLPDAAARFHVALIGRSRGFVVTECPGVRLQRQESATTEDLDNVLDRLDSWTQRLKEDMLARSPWAKEVQALRETFTAKLDSINEDLEAFFTNEEAAALARSLNELRDRVQEIAGENAELKTAVSTLSKAVADLQAASERVNKGTWYRMAGGRLLSGLRSIATSKEAREFALEAAKKLLLEGPK